MKKLLIAVLFTLFVSPVLADTATPAAPAAPAVVAPADFTADAVVVPKAKKAKGGDEAGIKNVFKEVSDAWAAGDAAAVASHFLKDGSLINPFGQDAWNREDIQKVVAGDLQMMSGSTQTFDDFKIHFVLPGFALVDTTGTISGMKNPDGTPAPDMSVHVYGTFALRGSKWLALSLRPYVFAKSGNAAAVAAAAPAAAAPAAAAPAATPASDAPAVDVPVPATK